jgi:hypothetical protein
LVSLIPTTLEQWFAAENRLNPLGRIADFTAKWELLSCRLLATNRLM